MPEPLIDLGADPATLSAAVTRALPPLGDPERLVGLAAYHLMSEGEPASVEAIARRAGMTSEAVAGVLASLPTAALEGNEVTGFLGLQVAPTTHRIAFPRASGGTWCAWDALFLPLLLRVPVRIESQCPVTSEPILVEVDPSEGVVRRSPDEARLSFLATPQPYAGNIVAEFCRWVHFLSGPAAADAFADEAARTGGTHLITLSLDEGIEIGRRTNASVFGVTPGP